MKWILCMALILSACDPRNPTAPSTDNPGTDTIPSPPRGITTEGAPDQEPTS